MCNTYLDLMSSLQTIPRSLDVKNESPTLLVLNRHVYISPCNSPICFLRDAVVVSDAIWPFIRISSLTTNALHPHPAHAVETLVREYLFLRLESSLGMLLNNKLASINEFRAISLVGKFRAGIRNRFFDGLGEIGPHLEKLNGVIDEIHGPRGFFTGGD
ncbi:hypothetical protein B0H13DRAFT_1852940 [Mycena leptocephala]|nr:hypothetical protein B0H13DRAFT_1852940 [Mycena leptocephala]